MVGTDDGIGVWLDPARPGLHFRIYDPPSPFEIAGTWKMNEHGLVLVELTVRSRHPATDTPLGLRGLLDPEAPIEPPTHITGAALRSVSVPELERRTRAAMRAQSEFEAEMEWATEQARKQGMDIPALYQVPKAARNVMQQLREASYRPGRQGYPIGLYEWVAAEYLSVARRKSKGILQELAERASDYLGWEVTASNVRDWVHRARELNLLSKGIPGKAHAEPGPALRADFH